MKNQKLNLLQKQKTEYQLELNNLLHSSTKDSDKISELKSEIIHINKQIEKIVGKKEIERQNEFKNKKFGIEEKNKSDYYNLKTIIKKISPMKIATNRMIKTIENRFNNVSEEKVRVKI